MIALHGLRSVGCTTEELEVSRVATVPALTYWPAMIDGQFIENLAMDRGPCNSMSGRALDMAAITPSDVRVSVLSDV